MVQFTALSQAVALMMIVSSSTSVLAFTPVAPQQLQRQSTSSQLFSSTDGNSLAALKVEVCNVYASIV